MRLLDTGEGCVDLATAVDVDGEHVRRPHALLQVRHLAAHLRTASHKPCRIVKAHFQL